MHIIEVTAEEIINSSAREYNPAIWEEKVLSYSKYKGVQYFKDMDENEKFYVKYGIKEGLIFFSEISYVSCMHSGGFTRLLIVEGRYAPSELREDSRFAKITPTTCIAYKRGFGEDGESRVVNSKEGRKWLVDNICKYGVAVTNN